MPRGPLALLSAVVAAAALVDSAAPVDWSAEDADDGEEGSPWRAFLAQFADEEAFRRHHGPGFCSSKPAAPCRSISRRLLPPSGGGLEIRWPEAYPFDKTALRRDDETDDKAFYAEPRLVQHFGEEPRQSLAAFYADVVASLGEIAFHVDLCSSWVSHLPEGYAPRNLVGLGMNGVELERNERLTRFVVQDLNQKPSLPFADDSVDIFTNAMSVDYLIRPLDVFREMRRALRPGGIVVLSFSNRFFPTKVIRAWTHSDAVGRCAIAASYLRYTGFERIAAYEVHTGTKSNPLHVVLGYAPAGAAGATLRREEEL